MTLLKAFFGRAGSCLVHATESVRCVLADWCRPQLWVGMRLVWGRPTLNRLPGTAGGSPGAAAGEVGASPDPAAFSSCTARSMKLNSK